ncbi:hypothetical protein A3A95_03065 [Candidatus Nomurabacteria bacterium RIFCSPLOWO2_01_FULL_39_18]|uniref:Uncharacterized protein n=1 Tax=Candidatus Nomurabacteria bacterium RIFCSPHIGHO2_01_FULL_40_24b TaxID=1801739 RepID=A0A1F6V7P2_9BACT|nr:MAG: hypothetical protein A2647_03500 [Candidatus Nomurabacteria bacterium RIFCSPHIGHO2_01_FULL_40_24b]OGI89637.1 MAG: hypothetical protein A3A95_03065 [Candidatus Nomurabacteria bacterium RIFCSPLOWO2_01_FULL_39_18]
MNKKTIVLTIILALIVVAGWFYWKQETMKNAPKCGGIAGLMCPEGYECEMGVYKHPDQMGYCKKTDSTTQPVKTTNETNDRKTYANTEYGFEFKYSPDEKIEMLDKSSTPQDNTGEKVISIYLEDSKDKLTCIDGEDVRCKNIANSDYNIVEQLPMTGGILVSIDLMNGKAVFLSLSCDSMGIGMTGKNDYCEISTQRQEVFENLLSTFKFTK